ncbi:hypothetical protein RJ640_007439 [Escallonia rubra]|uniref:Uncharacterized protein n=1 Tax=Escallonia rubra TaxID=112253 RepID=A0AA88SIM3_9ASTE|nr:hypothetical protein RJ640_007439 [Escallonia rubra]
MYRHVAGMGIRMTAKDRVRLRDEDLAKPEPPNGTGRVEMGRVGMGQAFGEEGASLASTGQAPGGESAGHGNFEQQKRLQDIFNTTLLHETIVQILDVFMSMEGPHSWVDYLMPKGLEFYKRVSTSSTKNINISDINKFDQLMTETRSVLSRETRERSKNPKDRGMKEQ